MSIEKINDEIMQMAISRALQAINKGKVDWLKTHDSDVLKLQVYAYPIAKILVSLIGNPLITKKYIDGEAKGFIKNIELESKGLDFSIRFARNEFQLGADYAHHPRYDCSVPFIDYLKCNFNERDLNFVNMPVRDGLVFLSDHQLNIMLASMLSSMLSKTISRIPVEMKNPPEKFFVAARDLRERIKLKVSKKLSSADAFKGECAVIEQILAEGMSDGRKRLLWKVLPHYLRLKGKSMDEVKEILSKWIDLSDEIEKFDGNKSWYVNYYTENAFDRPIQPLGCEKIFLEFSQVSAWDKLCEGCKRNRKPRGSK
ncbi:MAG: hypothetical protein KAS30_04645 [Candidatus Diapherotrites archaeon]|nr:hypothetical protein [Candidatus Diapherotrites archaeon]